MKVFQKKKNNRNDNIQKDIYNINLLLLPARI